MINIFAALFLLFVSPAHAQCTGVFPLSTVCGNDAVAPAPPRAITFAFPPSITTSSAITGGPFPFAFGAPSAGPGTNVGVFGCAVWNCTLNTNFNKFLTGFQNGAWQSRSIGTLMFGFDGKSFPGVTTWDSIINNNVQPVVNSTLTVNGTVITFVTGAPVGNQVQIGASAQVTITNLLTFLQTSGDAQIIKCQWYLNQPNGGPFQPPFVISCYFLGTTAAAGSYTISSSSSPASNLTIYSATPIQGGGDIPPSLTVPGGINIASDGANYGPTTLGFYNSIKGTDSSVWFIDEGNAASDTVLNYAINVGCLICAGVQPYNYSTVSRVGALPSQWQFNIPIVGGGNQARGTLVSDGTVPTANSTLTLGGTPVTFVSGAPIGSAVISGNISATTLTVSSVISGTVTTSQVVTGTGVAAGTVITSGSGVTWTVNTSQSIGVETLQLCGCEVQIGTASYPFTAAKVTLGNLVTMLQAATDLNLSKTTWIPGDTTVYGIFGKGGIAGNSYTIVAGSGSHYTASGGTFTGGDVNAATFSGPVQISNNGDGSAANFSVTGQATIGAGALITGNSTITGTLITSSATGGVEVKGAGSQVAIDRRDNNNNAYTLYSGGGELNFLAAGGNTITMDTSANFNVPAAATYESGGTPGVSCAAGTVSLATLTVTKGIVTHC